MYIRGIDRMTIQFEFVKTESGDIVHVSQAEKGISYFCANLDCNGQMIFRRGEIRTPHFAHKHKDFDHEGESILHYNTKILLFDYIKKFISSNDPLYLQFECDCSQIHGINILDGVDDVCMEKNVNSVYRPDIALSRENEIKIVIEVVVTHDIEPEATAYLKNQNIPYIKILTTQKLYAQTLKKYQKYDSCILILSENVGLVGISTLDYCNNNIPVTYYPDLKNIFPCFGYNGGTDFRGKIDDGTLPCDGCIYKHSELPNGVIICRNPLAKKNVFAEWDDYETPTIFRFDKYYKSGERHRKNDTYAGVIEQIKKNRRAMEFFEYEIVPICFSGMGGKYMEVWGDGEWSELDDTEILMKQIEFCGGKHDGQNIEYVYKTDKQYLYWILKERPHKMLFLDEIVRLLGEMKAKGFL